MATVQLVINAVNKATGPLRDIADAAERTADKIDSLNGQIDRTGRLMAELEGAGRMASAGMKAAGREADILAFKLAELNRKLDEIDRDVTARVKVKVDVDRSALDRLEEDAVAGRGGRGGRGGLGNLLAMFAPGGRNAGTAFSALPLGAQAGLGAAALSAAPFAGTAIAGALTGFFGSVLAGIGIAGSMVTGTAPKAPAPNAVKIAQLRLAAAQGRLAGLGMSRSPAPGTAQSDQLRVTSARDRLTAALDRLSKLQGSSKSTAAQLASAHGSVASAQASLVSAQGRLTQLRQGGKAVTPAQLASAQASVLSAQNALSKAKQQQGDYTDFQQTYKLQLKVKAAFANLSSDAQDSLAKIGRSFVPVMLSVFDTADSTLKKLTPVFAAADKIIAGPFELAAGTLIRSFAQPEVSKSVHDVAVAFGQFLVHFTPQIPGIVKALAGGIDAMAQAFTSHPGLISAMSSVTAFLFRIPGYTMDALAALTRTTSWLTTGFPHDFSRGLDAAREITIRYGHDVAHEFDSVRHDIAHWGDDVLRDVRIIWNDVYGATIGALIRLGHDAEARFNSFRHGTADVFDGVRRDMAVTWDSVWNNTVGRAERGVNDVSRWIARLPGVFGSAVSGVGRTFGRIEGVLRSPVSWVLAHVLDPLFGAIDDVTHFVGLGSPLPRHLGMAAGGRITAGTSPVADDVLARVSRGETVVSAAHSKMLAPVFAAVGVPGYAAGGIPGGGIFGDIGHAIGSVANGGIDIGKIALAIMTGNKTALSNGKIAMALLTGNQAALSNSIASLLGLGGAGGAAGQFARVLLALPEMLLTDVARFLTGPRPAGNVAGWIMAAMRDTGAPMSWLGPLERLVQLESGGNPHAVNPVPVMGEHASGLFQTLPSTYAAFATVPGGMFNPVSDAVAGIRYIMSQYGSPFNIPGLFSGTYRGYDSGGILPPGFHLVANLTGRPEQVIPASGQAAGGHAGPLVHIGEMHVREESDATLVAQRLSGMIRAAGLGGGFR